MSSARSPDKDPGKVCSADVLTFLVFEKEKTDNRLLYLSIFQVGSVDLRLGETVVEQGAANPSVRITRRCSGN